MENKQFYIKYLTNGPVGLKTHILNTNTFEWVQTVFTVGDLVAGTRRLIVAFQQLPNSPLASSFAGDITLHLPEAVCRSALSEDCFNRLYWNYSRPGVSSFYSWFSGLKVKGTTDYQVNERCWSRYCSWSYSRVRATSSI
jgi:hypothetical protein